MPCLVLVTFSWFGVPQMPSKTDFSGNLTKILLKYHQVLDACAARGLHRLVIPQDLLLQNSYLSIFPGLQASKPANLQAFNPPRRVTRSANNPPRARRARRVEPHAKRNMQTCMFLLDMQTCMSDMQTCMSLGTGSNHGR